MTICCRLVYRYKEQNKPCHESEARLLQVADQEHMDPHRRNQEPQQSIQQLQLCLQASFTRRKIVEFIHLYSATEIIEN